MSHASPPAAISSLPVARASVPSLAARALGNVLLIAAAFCGIVAAAVLGPLGGWEYYTTPLATRGYLPAHGVLRPSGTVGLMLGITGALFMLATLPYALRKRWKPLARLGATKHWLEAHIFFGIVGPVLITFHTSFKFNGLISAGYWLMVAVWLSGFVGRYLYVRIPRSIRGVELTADQVERQLAALKARIDDADLPDALRTDVDAFHALVAPRAGGTPSALDLFVGELRVRVRLALLRRRVRDRHGDMALLQAVVSLAAERAALARRAAHLQRTRHLFELWHVFHRPLVYGMWLIVAVHIGIAVYLGYAEAVFGGM